MLHVGASSFLTTGSPKNFSQRARGKREKKSENLQPAAASPLNLLLTHLPCERRSVGWVSRSPNISRQRSNGQDTFRNGTMAFAQWQVPHFCVYAFADSGLGSLPFTDTPHHFRIR